METLSRRELLRLMGISSVAAVIAACQPKTVEVEKVVKETVEVEKIVKETVIVEKEAATAAPAQKVKIVYWDWWSMTAGASGEMFEYLPKGFAEVEPDIELEMRNVPFAEYFRAFLAAHAAGDVPDVMHSSVDWGRALYDRGAILELTERMEITPSMNVDQFLPGALFQQRKEGKQYGVPGEGPDHDTILYNKAYFEEAGLPSEREEVLQWDWNDFTEAAEALTKRDASGQIARSGFLVAVPTHHHLAFWAGCQGGAFYKTDETGVAFQDNNAAVDGLSWWKDLLDRVSQPIGPERQDFNQFLQGTTAMAMGGPWNYVGIMDGAPDMEWSAMLIPKKPVPNGQMSSAVWNNMLAIPSKGKHPDAGWKLLTYWCGLDFMLERLRIGSWMAPRKDFYDTAEYKAAKEQLPVIENVALAPAVGTSVAFIENEAIQVTINPILQGVMLGEIEPQAAVDEMVQKCDEILAKAGYA